MAWTPATHQRARILAVTADDVLSDDLLRLGAAVGVVVTVAPDALAGAAHWGSADLVVLDPVSLAGVRALALPQRSRTVVVAPEPHPEAMWRDAVNVGATAVISLPSGEPWLVDAFAEAASRLSTVAPVVCVVGGRGGAGASVLAAALARVAANEGLAAYLVDLDPAGCGAHVLLGVDHLSGNGWPDLGNAIGRVPPRALREGLPTLMGVKVLGWPDGGMSDEEARALPAPGVAGSVVEAAARDADVVTVDLPRWLCVGESDAEGSVALEVLTRADHVLLVTTADVRSALAARRVLSAPSMQGRPVGLVVRGPSPGGLTGDDMAEALGVPLLAFLPGERGLDRALDDGLPPAGRRTGPLRSAALKVLRHVAASAAGARPGVGADHA